MTTQRKLVEQAGMYNAAAKLMGAGDAKGSLTAAGSTQATALALTADINFFGTVGASTGAILPAAGAATIYVRNGGANALAVYPPVGGTINGAAANASFSVATTKQAVFVTADGVTWMAVLSA